MASSLFLTQFIHTANSPEQVGVSLTSTKLSSKLKRKVLLETGLNVSWVTAYGYNSSSSRYSVFAGKDAVVGKAQP